MPLAFVSTQFVPIELEVPYKRQYEYMIHSLMKEYGIDRQQAESMTEYDYTLMVAFKNLEGKKEEFLIENNK